ncbi:MAG: methyl-accepting chemotaxis protein [Nitrospirae bacterium]|nr:methyl-accepting chemotaxis protein [Nitrospirota bacterium]
MKRININLSIHQRILVGVYALILLFSVAGGLSILTAGKSAAGLHAVAVEEYPALKKTATLSATFDQIGEMLYQAANMNDADKMKQANQAAVVFRTTLSELKGYSTTDQESLKAIDDLFTSNYRIGLDVAKFMMAGDITQAQPLLDPYSSGIRALKALIQDNLTASEKRFEERLAGMSGGLDNSKNLMIGTIVAILLVGPLLAWSLSRSIVHPIRRVSQAIHEIAQGDGDLSQRITHGSKDEMGTLANHFNELLDKLNDIIRQVASTSEQLATSTETIASQNSQMAEGAQNQSTQALKIAAAMEQMNATVSEVSKNSSIAADSAREAMTIATKGGEVVQQTISGMQVLAERVTQSTNTIHTLGTNTDKIGEIVLVIDEIADQTNLLALNAAIEAARAGDQGRGFSVVADEVRKLAERTTQATKEIATMISAIQKETNNVVEMMNASRAEAEKETTLVNESGAALSNIIEVISSVTDMVEQIATAAREQAIATDEITTNIEGIANVTEETSSRVQQSAEAGTQLNRMASELQAIVGQFKLSGDADRMAS